MDAFGALRLTFDSSKALIIFCRELSKIPSDASASAPTSPQTRFLQSTWSGVEAICLDELALGALSVDVAPGKPVRFLSFWARPLLSLGLVAGVLRETLSFI